MESTTNVTYEKFLTNPCLNKLSLLPIDEETMIKIIDGLKAKIVKVLMVFLLNS